MNAMDLITRIDSLIRGVSPQRTAVARSTQIERRIAANASSNLPTPANPTAAQLSRTDTKLENGPRNHE